MLQIILGLSGIGLGVSALLWLIHQERRKKRFSPFTERMLRSPGHSLDIKLTELTDSLLIPYFTIGFIPIIYSLIVSKNTSAITHAITIALFFPIIILAFFHFRKTFLKAQKIRLGLLGEIYTGQELNYLMRQGAWVYHDIPYKYGNIDHLVISKAGIFTIETKAVRKPVNNKGGKDAQVVVTKKAIKFPHFTTSSPIQQAKQHTDYLKKSLSKTLGMNCPVFSVISLPGWNVIKNNEKEKNGFLVINPKRGEWLKKYLNQQERINKQDLARIVAEIEKLARSVEAKSNMTDPDASKYYSFFLNRKHEEYKL